MSEHDLRPSGEDLAGLSEQLECISRAARIGFWRFNAVTGHMHWSPIIAELLEAADDPTFMAELGLAIWRKPESLMEPSAAAALRASRADGVPFTVDFRLRTAMGRRVWVRMKGAPRKGGGKPTVLIGSLQDITDTRKMEDSSNRARRLLEGIVENLPTMVFVKHADSLRFSLLNRAAEDILGFPRDQMLGKTDQDLWPKAQADSFTAADREVLASSTVRKIAGEPIRTSSGDLRYLDTWKVALRDENKQPEYLLGISVDVTEERSILEALRVSSEKLRGLYEMSPLGIALTDMSGRYVEFNRAFQKICGYDESELKALDYWQLTPRKYARQEAEQLETMNRTGQYGPYEKEYIRKDGVMVPLRLSGVLVTGADGQRYIWSIVEDMTDASAKDELLRQAQKMDAVGRLTAGVAHDFNNLLAIICGRLELLLVAHKDLPDVQKFAGGALAAARRGGDLTQHLLAYGRKQPLSPKLCNVGRTVEKFFHLFGRTLPANIDISAGAIELDAWALLDEAQLDNCLLNLCLNARDAMPAGGEFWYSVEVAVTDRELLTYASKLPPGVYVVVTLRDTGAGMSPEVLGRAFDPFFTTKGEGEGSGLGLSMVYGFVRQSGGRIAIGSQPGAGTTIRLYFPVATQGVEQEALPQTGPETVKGTAAAWRILLVEDMPQVRETILLQLESLGYDVTAVPDAVEALDLLRTQKFDVVVSDLGLPGEIAGARLCELAVEIAPDIRVLTISGYNETLESPAAGAPAVRRADLRKPFTTAELKERLQDLARA